MERSCSLLIHGADRRLKDEIDAALATIAKVDAVTRFVEDERLALEQARTRRPDVVLVETRDVALLRRFAEATDGTRPEPALVIVCRGGEAIGRDDFFIQATRARVRDFLTRPISSNELVAVLDRQLPHEDGGVRSDKGGRVLSFIGNKGGVGKSTLAVNTAVKLGQRHPDDVLLVDASLQMGVGASMLDLDPETTLVDAVDADDRLDGALLRRLAVPHASGIRLLAAPRDAVEASRVDDAVVSRVLSLARREFRFVVIDTFPLLDGVAMAIIDLSDAVFVVCSSALPNVIGVQSLLGVLERVGLPRSRQKVLLNETHPSYAGRLSARDVADQLGRDIEAVFPFDRRILTAFNTGEPLAWRGSRRFGFAKAMHRFVADLDSLEPARLDEAAS